jgi:hypothetical protein
MLPTQTPVGPVIAAGRGFTVIGVVVVQPVPGTVYVIVVVPATTPVNIPDDGPIVATAVALLVQVPPPVASLNVIVDPPSHAVDGPVIDGGTG